MTTYVALLRAINLGKKNKVKMAELRSFLESIGLQHVQTYIQSGNIIFESEMDVKALKNMLEFKLEERFGFAIPVMLRTRSEWSNIIQLCPYADKPLANEQSIHISFLGEIPSEQAVNSLGTYENNLDTYQLNGKEVYLLFGQNLHKSNLQRHLQKLKTPATMRNWKTVMKLETMLAEREGK
ncbi:DUF1697 domain-containing protein [Virgibacillus ihumii]|uniref:DUF1697 domain-containing protein n=1 Tax=Virgibacillus ihumii TaxID=2686091 RepID=UPI00157CA515|nr:DUF1697 domain-containing protein [Virgibacillus ihumii]